MVLLKEQSSLFKNTLSTGYAVNCKMPTGRCYNATSDRMNKTGSIVSKPQINDSIQAVRNCLNLSKELVNLLVHNIVKT